MDQKVLKENQITPTQILFCKKITKKIRSLPISGDFSRKVDPVADGARDYYEKIANPMDLGTVLKNLDVSHYKTVDQWKNDMNLIWNNALSYNHAGTPLYYVADALMKLFQEYSSQIPRNEYELWSHNVNKATKKLEDMMKGAPGSNLFESSPLSTPKHVKSRIIFKSTK